MRRRALPFLLDGPGLTTAMHWRLADRLFEQQTSLLLGAIATLCTGALAFAQTRDPWLLAWAGSVIPLTGVRLWLARRYRRQVAGRAPELRGSGEASNPSGWARRFSYGAWGFGALWGTAGCVLLFPGHGFLKFLLISTQAGMAGGAVLRNHVSPAAALGQSLLIEVPLLPITLATGNPFYLAFSVLVLLHLATVRSSVRHLGEQSTALLRSDAEKAALLEDLGRLNTQLRHSNAALAELSMTDELTAIANRRGFFAQLQQDWRRCQRHETHLSLLLIDVDRFKAFNDRYGHPAGDACLRAVATAISDTLHRTEDSAARYGGEEFAVLLPAVDAHGTLAVARRLRKAIAALAVPHADLGGGVLTVSIGAATVQPTHATAQDALIEAADRRLYEAKQGGRDRCCIEEIVTPEKDLGEAGGRGQMGRQNVTADTARRGR